MTKRDFHESVWHLMEGQATDWLDTLAVEQLTGLQQKARPCYGAEDII